MSFTTPIAGLTTEQVRQRREVGLVNDLPPTSGRSVLDIIHANVFTRINAILAVLLAIVLYTGSIINGAFGLLIIANSIVGIIQELRAKRTLDRLSIVGRAKPMVIRDGKPAREIDREEIVVDDLIQVGPGDQIVVDGDVLECKGLEIDESSLTGESDPMSKHKGDEVFSGSTVVAGSGIYQARKVGAEAYAAKLAAEASKFTLTDSELFRGINKILRVITWILVPVAALTIYTQLFRSQASFNEALLAMVASLVPMVPEGLVLMTTIAFAVGVIRLGKRRVLVNELPAIEGLARVDIVCADKTGTLTENHMRLEEIQLLNDDSAEDVEKHLWALCHVDERPNSTARALIDELGGRANIESTVGDIGQIVPFTSKNKWTGLTYNNGRTWVLGAPDVLLAPGQRGAAEADELMKQGLRVLVLGASDISVEKLPHGSEYDIATASENQISSVALIVLGQTIRADAPETLDYFEHENVEVKMISGDNAAAVGAVGRSLGLEGAESPVDSRTLPEPGENLATCEFGDIVEQRTVFGRVTAEHKRNMVRALQARGHTVAMTGDGVNDVLALKEANLGVAMGDGAPATRAVAQLVLLDNKFSVLPHVVAEGRRVIGNIERVANLFLTKTIYSVILALAVGIAGMQYPFEPIHVTVTGWFTIGIPAFVLSLAPNHERARPGFASRVFRLALPAGVIVGVMTFGFWLWAHPGGAASSATVKASSTATLIVLLMSAFWVLVVVARPYEWWKITLLMVSGFAYLVIFSVKPIANTLHIYTVPGELLIAAIATGGIGILLIEALWWITIRAERRR